MRNLALHRHTADDPALHDVLALILESFAYMEGKIDPPSSIVSTTAQDLSMLCGSAEIWSIGSPAVACVCLTPLPDALSIGRLAVAQSYRGHGLGGRLMALAERRARHLGLAYLNLKVRVVLSDKVQLYQHLGFEITEEGTHPGFDRPTYWVMRKALPLLSSVEGDVSE